MTPKDQNTNRKYCLELLAFNFIRYGKLLLWEGVFVKAFDKNNVPSGEGDVEMESD